MRRLLLFALPFLFSFADFHFLVDIFLILASVFLRRDFYRYLLPLGKEDARGVVVVILYCVLVVCQAQVSKPPPPERRVKENLHLGTMNIPPLLMRKLVS